MGQIARRYTEEEKNKVVHLIQLGWKTQDISEFLNMNAATVRKVIVDVTGGKEEPVPSPVTPTVVKERRCLRCQEMFPSTGPGNRICPKCTIINDGRYDPETSDYLSHRGGHGVDGRN